MGGDLRRRELVANLADLQQRPANVVRGVLPQAPGHIRVGDGANDGLTVDACLCQEEFRSHQVDAPVVGGESMLTRQAIGCEWWIWWIVDVRRQREFFGVGVELLDGGHGGRAGHDDGVAVDVETLEQQGEVAVLQRVLENGTQEE